MLRQIYAIYLVAGALMVYGAYSLLRANYDCVGLQTDAMKAETYGHDPVAAMAALEKANEFCNGAAQKTRVVQKALHM